MELAFWTNADSVDALDTSMVWFIPVGTCIRFRLVGGICDDSITQYVLFYN